MYACFSVPPQRSSSVENVGAMTSKLSGMMEWLLMPAMRGIISVLSGLVTYGLVHRRRVWGGVVESVWVLLKSRHVSRGFIAAFRFD